MKKAFQSAKAYGIALSFAFVFISTFAFAGGLSGTYTINPSKSASSTNYLTFSDAATDLNIGSRSDGGTSNGPGVSGSVKFYIADGTYKETVRIGNIPGSSATNTVTFQSKSGDSTKVILEDYANGYSSLLTLDSTNWLVIKQITITRIGSGAGYGHDDLINLMDGASNNKFLNNRIIGIPDPLSDGDDVSFFPAILHGDTSNFFISNYFKIHGTGYGIYIDSDSSEIIDGNIFDSAAVNISYSSGCTIRNNIFKEAYSLTIADCDSLKKEKIYNNKFLKVTIEISSSFNKTVADVYNNFFSDSSYSSINLSGNSDVSVYDNNIYKGAGSLSQNGISIYNVSKGNVRVINNNIYSKSAYAPLYADKVSSVVSCSYNNLYSTGSTLATWNGANYSSLSSLASGSGTNANSLNVDPGYKSSSDLHITNFALYGAGIPITGITTDIDGQLRDASHPTIGADEFIVSNDAGITAITSPASPYSAGTSDVKVDLKNFGASKLSSANINWSVNGTLQTAYSWVGSLKSDSIQNVTIGTHIFSASSYYLIKAWTSNPNSVTDSVRANDTSFISFTTASPTPPSASYIISASLVCIKDSAKFTDKSTFTGTDSIKTWAWNFGDGNSSSLKNPRHVYSSGGYFSIRLIVTAKSGASDTANGKIFIDSTCVWPGDANYDKVVDASDVLNIGLGFGKTGPARPSANITWIAQPCQDWKDTFSKTVNYKQADCNGDSTIGYSDTLAITANYSKTHLKTLSRIQGKPSDAPLQIVLNKDSAQIGDFITADVYLGTKTSNIKNIYGLCFGMNFNSALVDTNSISIDYTSNWFATFNKNQLHFSKDLYGSDRMDFAITRIDHTNASGYGKICSIKMKVSNAVPKAGTKLNFIFSNNKQIDASGKYIPVYMSDDSIIVKQLLTGVENTIPSVSSLNVYPNPFKGFTNIEYSLSRDEKVLVEVFDMTGRRISLLANEEQVSGIHNLKFESNSAAGQYILRIQTGEQVIYKQIVGIK